MNHMQSQAELKRNLQREARINKQKMRELKAKKVRENAHQRSDDDEYVTVEHDETFNMHHGYSWNADSLEQSDTPEFYRSKDSKLEAWLSKHQAGTETVCNSSSSDSLDSWHAGEKNIRHRAPLIRTKTEKIPTFDEFFDDNI